MIVKSKHVRASRVSQGQASSALKSHLKYLQYRERDPEQESRADRYLFNDEEDHIDRRAVHNDRLHQDLDWYAVQHHNTDDPHVHVVLSGTGIDRETGREEPVELTPQDFRFLRESGREHSDYDHYHFIQDTLHDLDERDTIIHEAPEHERENERMIEH